eukprot:TRINITY_DN5197_c0_g1_i1.p1 TRINITY_DN5197_c0_g1~~TRINITY_DN5197_c0_g1_i1.p1  ORF type:complete len:218 (-),score=52.55 TRINITY_DN5197_c0_g1_i1:67-720(-)
MNDLLPKEFNTQNSIEYQNTFQEMVSIGYRLERVRLTGSPTQPFYSSRYIRDQQQEDWYAFHGLQQDDYLALLRDWAQKSICPVQLSVLGQTSGPRIFAGVGIRCPKIWVEVHDLKLGELKEHEKLNEGRGMKANFICTYGDQNELAVAVWSKDKIVYNTPFFQTNPVLLQQQQQQQARKNLSFMKELIVFIALVMGFYFFRKRFEQRGRGEEVDIY